MTMRVCSDRPSEFDMSFLREFDNRDDRLRAELKPFILAPVHGLPFAILMDLLFIEDILQDARAQRAKRWRLRCEIENIVTDPVYPMGYRLPSVEQWATLYRTLLNTRDATMMVLVLSMYRGMQLDTLFRAWIEDVKTEEALVEYIDTLISMGIALRSLIQIEVLYAIQLGESHIFDIIDQDPIHDGIDSYDQLQWVQCSAKMRCCIVIWRELRCHKVRLDDNLAIALSVWRGKDIKATFPTAHDYLRITTKDCQDAYWQGERRLRALTIPHFAGADDHDRIYEVANLSRVEEKYFANIGLVHHIILKGIREVAGQGTIGEDAHQILHNIRGTVQSFAQLYSFIPIARACCHDWIQNLDDPHDSNDSKLDIVRRAVLTMQKRSSPFDAGCHCWITFRDAGTIIKTKGGHGEWDI